MTIKFHISNDILLSYSAGTLDEASSLLVATHLALCPHCRARNSSADALGGYLLDSLEATPVSPTMMASVLSQVRSDTNVSRAKGAVSYFFKCNHSRSAPKLPRRGSERLALENARTSGPANFDRYARQSFPSTAAAFPKWLESPVAWAQRARAHAYSDWVVCAIGIPCCIAAIFQKQTNVRNMSHLPVQGKIASASQ